MTFVHEFVVFIPVRVSTAVSTLSVSVNPSSASTPAYLKSIKTFFVAKPARRPSSSQFSELHKPNVYIIAEKFVFILKCRGLDRTQTAQTHGLTWSGSVRGTVVGQTACLAGSWGWGCWGWTLSLAEREQNSLAYFAHLASVTHILLNCISTEIHSVSAPLFHRIISGIATL